MKARTVIGILSGLGGAAAGAVGAVSLTRIAGDYLGFPDGLHWTLTAAVDIGAVAGAVMWSTSPHRSTNRATGVRLNVACSVISAIGVGLDHATHAEPIPQWQIVAFLIGAFLPLLSTWLVHALAKMTHARVVVKPRAEKAGTVKETAESLNETADDSGVPEPPKVTLTKTVRMKRPAGLTSVPRPTTPRIWVEKNWPCSPEQVEAATGCSRSTAFRVVKAVREARDGAAVA